MGLVVVDPDERTSASLCQQLHELNLDPLPAADLQAALEICDHVLPDLVICAQFDWAASLAESNRRLPVVLVSRQEPERDLLMDALRAGLADVWALPADNGFLSSRISAILDQTRSAWSEAEARLNEHVSDLQRDQRAGRYIQMGMLPPNPMAIDRFRLQHRIIPSLILSGDFVDYFRITDRYFAFYIADVSGHGASSAFVTVLLKNFSRRLRREYRPSMITEPGEILAWINRELLEQKIDKHVAMILAVGDLETDQLTLVNAGHFPPAILVDDGGARFVEQRGKPVGLFDKVSYAPTTVRMKPGSRLVLFSDGVLDALGAKARAAGRSPPKSVGRSSREQSSLEQTELEQNSPEQNSLEQNSLEQKEALLLKAAAHATMDGIWQSLDLTEAAAPDDMTCLTVMREK